MTLTALSLIVAVSCSALMGAASESAPSPEPAPDWVFGSTPADGCPRFFIALPLAQIDDCADRLAEAGWGLSAVAFVRRSGATGTVDLLAGAFEPHSAKRRLESDEDSSSKATGVRVNVLVASNHLITLYQAGQAHGCDDLTLYVPYEVHVDDKPKYFSAKMSERAAEGCVPGSYYSLIRREAIQQENPDEHVAFVPGDPHATAALWPRTGAERQAFEKRAAARGFQRLSLDDVPDRWGTTAGPRYVQDILLGSPPSRYDALQARLRAATQNGERLVDIRFLPDGEPVPTSLLILWERPAKPVEP